MTSAIPFCLASASPARLATLRRAGVDPVVDVSNVDEDAVTAEAVARFGDLATEDIALLLARAKCEDVSSRRDRDGWEGIVLGCDSVLELDGATYGKPADAEDAVQRWQLMRGRSGVLHTGHWVIDLRDEGSGATLGAVASTVVHFADLDDDEIRAYVATSEPLAAAGAFTIDAIGGPYVTGIEGDHHNVVGVSLPLLRTLVSRLGHRWPDLWG